MWDALMSWLPKFQVGIFELRDFVNILVAVVGLYLAMVGKRLADRQAEAAAREAARHATIVLNASDPLREDKVKGEKHYDLIVSNRGDKSCRGLTVYILVPEQYADFIAVGDYEPLWRNQNRQPYKIRRIQVDAAVYPGAWHKVGELAATKMAASEPESIQLLWAAQWDEGRNPSDHAKYHTLAIHRRFFKGAESQSGA